MNDLVDVDLLRAQVRDYLQQNFLFGDDGSALDDAAPLLEQGILDETGILELVLFLEETYNITVTEDDLLPEHFDTVDGIVAFVAGKLAV